MHRSTGRVGVDPAVVLVDAVIGTAELLSRGTPPLRADRVALVRSGVRRPICSSCGNGVQALSGTAVCYTFPPAS